jgi:hypothetical protein
MSTDITPATRPRWHWSYIDNIGWLSPDEAVAIDPWADNLSKSQPPIANEKQSDNHNPAELTPSEGNSTPAERPTTKTPSTGPKKPDSNPWADSA